MRNIKYKFPPDNPMYELEMVFVEGTNNKPFLFGVEDNKQEININDFFMAAFPVTQGLWKHVMGNDANRSMAKDDNRPVEHVSWNDITGTGGFLEKINAGNILSEINKQFSTTEKLHFRLPSETAWEYAARGGKHWKDNFMHSGSNDPDKVAWYKNNSGNETHPVGQKAPNQLGIYDMNGNTWEWCEDYFIRDTNYIPKDGSPFLDGGSDRVLRGGCHHNGDIHCRVSNRYEIIPDAADGCIGFRLVLQ
jgi:sulfatase modifying factor 1